MKRESDFQHALIREIESRWPGALVMKNDSGYRQGIPDLTVLYKDRWAALECKRSEAESHQPNQDYYVGRMDEMSFSRFICPENRESVLDELAEHFDGRQRKRRREK